MKSRFGVVSVVLMLCACGARTSDNHTGGKTSWLSACDDDSDCDASRDAVCISSLCTMACASSCAIDGTTCVEVDVAGRESEGRACLPTCRRDADCSPYGANFACEGDVCIVGETGSTGGEPGDVDPGDVVSSVSPVRDIAGVVLLDTGDDGDEQPLVDEESPRGFDSRGHWYTYDDKEACMGDEDPNRDRSTILVPASNEPFVTTAYQALAISPPPEVLANAPENTHAIRVSGGGQEYFGAGLAFRFDAAYGDENPGLDWRAAGYTGLRFWMYSPIDVTITVKLQDAYSEAAAGLCAPRGPYPECQGTENCLNGGAQMIDVRPNDWQLYELYFSEVEDDPATAAVETGPFERANWEGQVDVENNEIRDIPPTPDRIYQLQFQTTVAPGQDGVFDIIVDNVGFIEASGPEDNAEGRFE